MMKKFIVGLVLASIAMPAVAQVHVKGYVRKDGTYVAPHVRTRPDNSRLNNYGTAPNVNPYTGRVGTVNPYAPPAPNSGSTYTPPCYFNCGDDD